MYNGLGFRVMEAWGVTLVPVRAMWAPFWGNLLAVRP